MTISGNLVAYIFGVLCALAGTVLGCLAQGQSALFTVAMGFIVLAVATVVSIVARAFMKDFNS